MTGIDKALLRHLLLIDGPWEIADYQLDLRRRRCDVWVTPQVERGWFGRPKSAPRPAQQHVWQHIAFGNLRFHMHVTVPDDVSTQQFSWMGVIGQPFTAALAQQVFMFFNEGLTLQSICTVLKLSLNDVWRYRFALDNGRAQVQATPGAAAESAGARTAAAPRGAGASASASAATSTAGNATSRSPYVAPSASAASPAASASAEALSAMATENDRSATIPDVADPVWLRLISGDLQLDIKVLSLKLMLTRVRSQLDLISDDEVRLLKLRDLHRYFVKNERVLTHELAQLRSA